jgi:hypothetical protein
MQNPKFPLCPTSCQTSFQINWQQKFGIIRLDPAAGAPALVDIPAAGNVLINIPKDSVLIGFAFRKSPVAANSPWIFGPANGTTITANFDTFTANSMGLMDSYFTKLMNGAAEEKSISPMIDYALCTGNFAQIAADRPIKVSNLGVVTYTVQAIILDFSGWVISH